MSSVRRMLRTATFRCCHHTEQCQDELVEEKSARLMSLYVTRIAFIAVATAARTRATRRAMRRQESMTVGGFWAASDNKWVGD